MKSMGTDIERDSEEATSTFVEEFFDDNLPIPRQVSDPSTTSLTKFKYNAERESETHFRISNFAIKALMTLSPDSWRIFSSISEHLDIYPIDLINDEEFLTKFVQGRAPIPERHRTVKLKATHYEKRWKLPKGSAYRTFTLDALSLYEDSLISTRFLGDEIDKVKLTRPISSIAFSVQAIHDGKKNTRVFGPESIAGLGDSKEREKGIKERFWQAKEIEFVLSEQLVQRMFMVQRYFTRIEKVPTSSLTKPANKMFAILCMFAGANTPINGKWSFSLNLLEINSAFKLSARSIPKALEIISRYCKEINSKTQFKVNPYSDPLTKDGNAFTQINFDFSEDATLPVLESKKEIVRKLIPRPRVEKGSMAEKEWAKKNLRILLDYEVRLQRVNRKLPAQDERRVLRYKEMLQGSSF